MTHKVIGLILIACIVYINARKETSWEPVVSLLENAIADEAFPGCVALVADKNGVLFSRAIGRFTYDSDSTSMTLDSLFDMASVTKVLMTTTAIAQFYQRGELNLGHRVSDMFPEFSANGKKPISVENLLLHNSGLPGSPTPYRDPAFGCPESLKYNPAMVFDCMPRIFDALMAQNISNPVGSVFLYSDLSMITLMYVVGKLAKELGYVAIDDIRSNCPLEQKGSEQCYFEAYVRKYVLRPVNMNQSGFLPSIEQKQNIPPAWIESKRYRHKLVQGFVSDPNAYAMGGIAGHAGLFATVGDVSKIMNDFMFTQTLLNSTTIKLFTSIKNQTQSSRALGWDTNLGPDGICGTLSQSTFLHLGFTGTQMCGDFTRNLFTVLLTNRVYPNEDSTKIKAIRKAFNTAVQKIYDGV